MDGGEVHSYTIFLYLMSPITFVTKIEHGTPGKLHLFLWVWWLRMMVALEESLSITTGRCDLAIATYAREMHKKFQYDCQLEYFS